MSRICGLSVLWVVLLLLSSTILPGRCVADAKNGVTVKKLTAVVADKKRPPEDRAAAAKKLYRLAPIGKEATSVLIDTFADPNENVRLGAYYGVLGQDRSAIRQLIDALGSGEPRVRELVCSALETFSKHEARGDLQGDGPRPKEAMPHVVPLLKDPVDDVRIAALEYLSVQVNRNVPRHISSLLTDHSAKVRAAAVNGLARFGASECAVKIATLLKDKDVVVRRAAAEAIGELGSENGLPPLLEAFEKEKSPDMKWDLACAIGQFKSNRKAIRKIADYAVQVITKNNAKLDEIPGITGIPLTRRRSMALDLAQWGPGGHDALVRVIANDKLVSQYREAAASAFAFYVENHSHYGGTDRELKDLSIHLPVLAGLLGDRNVRIRSNAIEIIGSVGKKVKAAFSILDNHLAIATDRERALVAQSMYIISPNNKKTIPTLVSLLRSKDLDARVRAIQILGKMDVDGLSALPALINESYDPNEEVRTNVIFALEGIAPTDMRVLARFKQIHEDRDEVRRLRKITGRFLKEAQDDP